MHTVHKQVDMSTNPEPTAPYIASHTDSLFRAPAAGWEIFEVYLQIIVWHRSFSPPPFCLSVECDRRLEVWETMELSPTGQEREGAGQTTTTSDNIILDNRTIHSLAWQLPFAFFGAILYGEALHLSPPLLFCDESPPSALARFKPKTGLAAKKQARQQLSNC